MGPFNTRSLTVAPAEKSLKKNMTFLWSRFLLFKKMCTEKKETGRYCVGMTN